MKPSFSRGQVLASLALLVLMVIVIAYGFVSSTKAADITPIRGTTTPKLKAALSAQNLRFGAPVYIRIFKESRELELWVKGDEDYRLFKTYRICAFSGELGPKTKEGDNQAPEGFYSVTKKQLNPKSNYHLAFNLGYPNAYDRANGYTGSYLMVHGNCVSIGCYAMTDKGIEEIYLLVEAALSQQNAIPVHIFPFRMTNQAMTEHKDNRWLPFWQTLQPAYLSFETKRIPPRIGQKGRSYTISDHAP